LTPASASSKVSRMNSTQLEHAAEPKPRAGAETDSHRLPEGRTRREAVGESIAWAKPGVGHHACLADEGDERVVRVAAFAVGVVAFGRAFLAALAGDDGAAERSETACLQAAAKR